MPKQPTIAELLSQRLAELGWSKSALKEQSGQDYKLILRCLPGEHVPNEESAGALAAAMKVPEAAWRAAWLASKRVRKRAAAAAKPLETYLAGFIAEHGSLRPIGIAQTNKDLRAPLSEVFVSLTAETEETRVARETEEVTDLLAHEEWARTREKEPAGPPGTRRRAAPVVAAPVELATVLANNAVVVITGQPGSGKTTLLEYAGIQHAHALLEGRSVAADAHGQSYGKPMLPVYIRVAAYAERGRGRSLREYLRMALAPPPEESGAPAPAGKARPLRAERAALSAEEGVALFDRLWAKGEILLLLDGLDEITDTDARAEVNVAIHELAELCRKQGVRMAVTCRVRSYSQAPLSGMPVFAIHNMSPAQIDRFFRAWCPAMERAQGAARWQEAGEKQAQAILYAVEINAGVRDLAVNPLLCTLIALIHRNEFKLPERRAALMAKAVETLLRLWRPAALGALEEAARPFLISTEEEARLLRPLALWLHETRSSGIVAQMELFEWLTNQLAAQRGKPKPEAKEGAEAADFLDRVSGQSGVLVERAQGYYGFLHLLFEEYLAGVQLTSNTVDAAERIRELRHQPRWEEPIRLGIAAKSPLAPGDAGYLICAGILGQRRAHARWETDPTGASELEAVLHRDLCLAARCLADCESVDLAVERAVARQFVAVLLDPEQGISIESLREYLIRSMDGLWQHEAAATVQRDALLAAIKRKDEHWSVRSAAAQALAGQASEPSVRDALLAAIKDEHWSVRSSAWKSLERGVAGGALMQG